jgi:transcriptional regulator with XRE-family HTH domain
VKSQLEEVIFVLNYDFRMSRIRKWRGLTQKDLANKLNTTSQQISKYETLNSQPTLDRLVEIARILDVSLDELVVIKKIHSEYSNYMKEKFL